MFRLKKMSVKDSINLNHKEIKTEQDSNSNDCYSVNGQRDEPLTEECDKDIAETSFRMKCEEQLRNLNIHLKSLAKVAASKNKKGIYTLI